MVVNGERFMLRIEHYEYSKNKKVIEQIYEDSFPINEKFKFSILKRSNKSDNVHLSSILLNDKVIGMQFTVALPNDNITYLMYFAIKEQFRCQRLGSKALQQLVVTNNNILLCIERPCDELTKSRKSFYLRNGFYETGVFIEDTDTQYEMLTSMKDYKPTDEDLRNRYECMTKNKWLKNKIMKSFDANCKVLQG